MCLRTLVSPSQEPTNLFRGLFVSLEPLVDQAVRVAVNVIQVLDLEENEERRQLLDLVLQRCATQNPASVGSDRSTAPASSVGNQKSAQRMTSD